MIEKVAAPSPGLRERKRQETLRKITDAGISLFIDKGIDATTLDEIAAKAGISRRTFFHYFKSKDDILLSLQQGMGEMIAVRVRRAGDRVSPIDAIRTAVIAACVEVPADDMVAIDRLMRSSPAVQARKQASYVEHERTLFDALRERWPNPAREMALRLIAMLAIGAIRLATEALGVEGERRTLIELMETAFDALSDELLEAGTNGRTA
ncbi:TetR/AcrR family transcriptional regulator [Sphingomonas crocodyli]|uniref:TetR family transcriptional regulator n=1 Tax=Sphingomonas crocodyli TaxID=1979270 RepID=A0A437M5W9_9SPHN|nr:TetR/AcrR family transcriptional regulator [Sphingomonas crocodyli]RVT92983.1 TetR family transcriptional regulator [Sphingomonas crocodyli]